MTRCGTITRTSPFSTSRRGSNLKVDYPHLDPKDPAICQRHSPWNTLSDQPRAQGPIPHIWRSPTLSNHQLHTFEWGLRKWERGKISKNVIDFLKYNRITFWACMNAIDHIVLWSYMTQTDSSIRSASYKGTKKFMDNKLYSNASHMHLQTCTCKHAHANMYMQTCICRHTQLVSPPMKMI